MSRDKSFESNLVPKLHLPQVGDKPFIQSTDCRQNSDISLFSDSDDCIELRHFRHYCMNVAYKEGADLLVERAYRDHYSSIDLLTFPIIFCYRHYIELSLKFLIVQYGKDTEVRNELITHNLSKLWEMVNDVIKEHDIEDVDDSATAVTEIIDDFENLDPGSFSFRYPDDKNGNQIEHEQELFDLNNLSEVMSRLENYIDFLDGNFRQSHEFSSKNNL